MEKAIQRETKLSTEDHNIEYGHHPTTHRRPKSITKPQRHKKTRKSIKLWQDNSQDESIFQTEAVVESENIVKQFKTELFNQQCLHTSKSNIMLKDSAPVQDKSESKLLDVDFQQQLREEKKEDDIDSEQSATSGQLEETAEVELWSDSCDSFIAKLSYLKRTPKEAATEVLSLMKLDKIFSTLEEDSTPSLEETVGSTFGISVESSNEMSYSDQGEIEDELEMEETMQAESISSSEPVEDDELLIWLTEDEASEASKDLTEEEDTQKRFLFKENIDMTDDLLKAVLLNYIKEFRIKQMVTDTTDILNDIIKSVVNKCEEKRNDPKIFLRQNLNKSLLMQDLMIKLAELEGGQRIRNYLYKRVGSFFSSNRKYRVFTEETSDTIKANTKIYKDTLMKLDMALGREEQLKEKSTALIDELEDELSSRNNKCIEKLEEFEEIVKNTFALKGEHVNALILSELAELRKMRDAVSAVRCELIAKQHTYAILSEKVDKFKHPGNNLQLADYEELSRELIILHNKDMERNSELQRIRLRFNKALNIRKHIKEEKSLQNHKIFLGKLRLKNLQRKKKSLRKHISKLQTERERIRKETSEILKQREILGNPALMKDYSATLQNIENVKRNVGKLREEHDKILYKIMELQGNEQ